MTWVRLDDRATSHPKLLRAGPEACWLWLAGLCYCNAYGTDGLIETSALPSLCPGVWSRGKVARLAAKLVDARLWIETRSGFAVKSYEEYQETALKTNQEQRRKLERERKRAWRSKRKSEGVPSLSHRTPAQLSPHPGPARPVLLTDLTSFDLSSLPPVFSKPSEENCDFSADVPEQGQNEKPNQRPPGATLLLSDITPRVGLKKAIRRRIGAAPGVSDIDHVQPCEPPHRLIPVCESVYKDTSLAEQCRILFVSWAKLFGKGTAVRLGDDRNKAFLRALQWGYSVETLVGAMAGAANNSWYMGENDRDKVYDAPRTILKSSEKIEEHFVFWLEYSGKSETRSGGI